MANCVVGQMSIWSATNDKPHCGVVTIDENSFGSCCPSRHRGSEKLATVKYFLNCSDIVYCDDVC